ncbi:unnamed protein product [Staurois parvus]|uniref:Uncharacterized protein n=1 Tax=Staurois parvus TaxID=386267 RepID=A0ABN9GGZ8_9NEOB|nr:unnamed protein product [Staurois parvus]
MSYLTTSHPARVYKRPDGSSAGEGGRLLKSSRLPACACSLGAHGTAITVRDLCVRSQSLITCRVVSKMSLLTSLLTMCEICE